MKMGYRKLQIAQDQDENIQQGILEYILYFENPENDKTNFSK